MNETVAVDPTVPAGLDPVRARWLAPAMLVLLVAINYLWKREVDGAGRFIVSYIGTYQHAFLAALPQQKWWEFLLPMPELNGGVWATTGILGVYALELLMGNAPRAYYAVTSLAVATAFAVTWQVYRSLLFAFLVGLSFALSTYVYISYALSGGVIIPLVTSFAMFFAYAQYRLFVVRRSFAAWGIFFVALVLYAVSYEGWLDFVVAQWVAYSVLAYAFYKSGDRERMRVALTVLLITTAAALLYTGVKISMSYQTLHGAGNEADTVFNYPRGYLVLAAEDVLANVITNFYAAVITYVPPQLFNFSMSSWLFGMDDIVRLQSGYHSDFSQNVVYSHIFLWRFYGGMAFALFLWMYFRVIRELITAQTSVTVSLFVFLTALLVGSPTHAMVKMRPMHATPVLMYQVYLAVIGVTFLASFAIFYLKQKLPWPWFYTIVALFCFNLFYCALERPALLSHMSVLSGLYPYPIPKLF